MAAPNPISNDVAAIQMIADNINGFEFYKMIVGDSSSANAYTYTKDVMTSIVDEEFKKSLEEATTAVTSASGEAQAQAQAQQALKVIQDKKDAIFNGLSTLPNTFVLNIPSPLLDIAKFTGTELSVEKRAERNTAVDDFMKQNKETIKWRLWYDYLLTSRYLGEKQQERFLSNNDNNYKENLTLFSSVFKQLIDILEGEIVADYDKPQTYEDAVKSAYVRHINFYRLVYVMCIYSVVRRSMFIWLYLALLQFEHDHKGIFLDDLEKELAEALQNMNTTLQGIPTLEYTLQKLREPQSGGRKSASGGALDNSDNKYSVGPGQTEQFNDLINKYNSHRDAYETSLQQVKDFEKSLDEYREYIREILLNEAFLKRQSFTGGSKKSSMYGGMGEGLINALSNVSEKASPLIIDYAKLVELKLTVLQKLFDTTASQLQKTSNENIQNTTLDLAKLVRARALMSSKYWWETYSLWNCENQLELDPAKLVTTHSIFHDESYARVPGQLTRQELNGNKNKDCQAYSSDKAELIYRQRYEYILVAICILIGKPPDMASNFWKTFQKKRDAFSAYFKTFLDLGLEINSPVPPDTVRSKFNMFETKVIKDPSVLLIIEKFVRVLEKCKPQVLVETIIKLWGIDNATMFTNWKNVVDGKNDEQRFAEFITTNKGSDDKYLDMDEATWKTQNKVTAELKYARTLSTSSAVPPSSVAPLSRTTSLPTASAPPLNRSGSSPIGGRSSSKKKRSSSKKHRKPT